MESVGYTVCEDRSVEESENNDGENTALQRDMNSQQPSEIVSAIYEAIEENVMHDLDNDEVFEDFIKVELEHLASREEQCEVTFNNSSDSVKKCNVCDLVFSHGRYLANHQYKHHPNAISQFSCEFCNMTFGTKSSQRVHQRTHTGYKPYKCSSCSKSFADKGTFNKHLRIHTREKPFECAVCPKAFNQKITLRSHIRSLHSAPNPRLGTSAKPFSCSVCKNLFATAEDLIQDLYKHCDFRRSFTRKRPLYTDSIQEQAKPVGPKLIRAGNMETDDNHDGDAPEVPVEINSASSTESSTTCNILRPVPVAKEL